MTNFEWSKTIYNRILYESWDRTDFTTLTLSLATETGVSLTFLDGRVGTVKFETRFTSIRFIKLEDFCVAIAFTYFVENCLDLL